MTQIQLAFNGSNEDRFFLVTIPDFGDSEALLR